MTLSAKRAWWNRGMYADNGDDKAAEHDPNEDRVGNTTEATGDRSRPADVTVHRADTANRDGRDYDHGLGVPRMHDRLHVEFFSFLGAIHDEAEPRRRVLPHQFIDDAVRDDLIGDFDAQQAPRPGIERRFP